MSEQVYMTAKLNLSDGTILYPQVSLDNIVASISDPTLVTVATTTGGKVPTSQLPVVTVVGSGATDDTVPTAAAVRSLADTKQNTLVAGTGTEIINGSTINAMAVNLNDVVVNNVPNNGLYLEVDGNTMSVVGELAANDSAGVIAGATNGVQIDANGYAQFDNTTVDAATPAEITGGTTNKVVQADDLDTALRLSKVKTSFKSFAEDGFNGAYITAKSDGEIEVVGTAVNTVSCGIYLFTNTLPKLLNPGSYAVYFDVYVSGAGSKFQIGYSGASGSFVSSVGGIYWGNTTVKNEWVTVGVTLKTDVAIGYLMVYMSGIAVNDAIAFKIRNLHIVDVTGVPVENFSAIFGDSGYLYEPSAGIVIDGKSILVDEASPSDSMAGVSTKTMTPNSIKSALSVGQCVDCTAVPQTDMTFVDPSGESGTIADLYRGTFGLTSTATTAVKSLGFYVGNYYPKAAETADGTPLKYLFMCDVTNNGTTILNMYAYASTTGSSVTTAKLFGASAVAPNTTVRVAFTFNAGMVSNVSQTTAKLMFVSATSAAYDITISNLREFEVMALTDDAIKYLASVENPDNADAQYLIKTDMVSPWTNIINMGSAPAVTLASGLAYKSTILTGGTCTFSTDTVPAGTYGRDAHLTLFVGLDSQAFFQPPLSLMDPLTPGAGHNMTIKYRDGQALAYVDDTDIGYVVTIATGTDSGSLPYGFVDAANEYIVFSQLVDGSTIEGDYTVRTGSTAANIIGNGIDSTHIAVPMRTEGQLSISDAEITEGIASTGSIRLNNCYVHDIPYTITASPDTTNTYARFAVGSGAYVKLTGCTFSNIQKYCAYTINMAYKQNDFVHSDENSGEYRIYRCLQDVTTPTTDISDTTTWEPGYTDRGSWSATAGYSVKNFVYYSTAPDNGYYFCIQDVPANSGIGITNTAYWTKVNRFWNTNWGALNLYPQNNSTVDSCVFSYVGGPSVPAIFNTGLSIKNSVFDHCGYIQQYSGSVEIEGCTFSNPAASLVLYLATRSGVTSNDTIKDCTIDSGSINICFGTISFAGTNILGSTVYGSQLTSQVQFAADSSIISPNKDCVITGFTHTFNNPSNVTLDGVTFKDMRCTGAYFLANVTESDLTIKNCVFNNCKGPYGALIAGKDGATGITRTIKDTKFINCQAGYGIVTHGVDFISSLCENVEISGCTTAGGPFYISRDVPASYPTPVVTVNNLWIHDNYGGSVFYISGSNWDVFITGLTTGHSIYFANNKASTNVYLISGNTIGGARNASATGTRSFVRIQKDTTLKITDVMQRVYMSVGNYDSTTGTWTVGGSASIVYLTGTTTVSGLGTTFNASTGENDFQAPYMVTVASGTGEGTLYAGISGSSNYVMLDSSVASASATLSGALTVTDKAICGTDGVPYVRGTFSMSSGGTVTVTQATRRVDFDGTGTTVTSLYIPKNTTVSFHKNTAFQRVGGVICGDASYGSVLRFDPAEGEKASFPVVYYDNVLVTGVTVTHCNSDSFLYSYSPSAMNCDNVRWEDNTTAFWHQYKTGMNIPTGSTVSKCVFDNYTRGGASYALSGVIQAGGGEGPWRSGTVTVTGCTFGTNLSTAAYRKCINNNVHMTVSKCVFEAASGDFGVMSESAFMDGCPTTTFTGNTIKCDISHVRYQDYSWIYPIAVFSGTNAFQGKMKQIVGRPESGTMHVVLMSDSVMNLRNNSNEVPIITPTQAIKVNSGGCKIVTTSGATVSVPAGMYSQITNLGVATGNAAYLVSATTGTASGSLPYGVTSNASPYIFFQDTLDTQTVTIASALDIDHAVTIAGNGRTNNTLTITASMTITSSLKITDLTFTGITVLPFDINTYDGDVQIENCAFSGNTATIRIWRATGRNRLIACQFAADNTATSGYAYCVVFGSGKIAECTFSCKNAVRLELGDNSMMSYCYFNYDNSDGANDVLYINANADWTLHGCSFGTGNNIYIKEGGSVALTGTRVQGVTNNGTITFYGTGNALAGMVITNNGTVTFQNGTILDFRNHDATDPISGTGTITIPSGVTVDIIPYGASSSDPHVVLTGPRTGTTLSRLGVLS